VEVLPFTEINPTNDFIGVQMDDEISESETEFIVEEDIEYIEDMTLNLTARITSISALGELEIKFNDTLSPISNLTAINSTLL